MRFEALRHGVARRRNTAIAMAEPAANDRYAVP